MSTDDQNKKNPESPADGASPTLVPKDEGAEGASQDLNPNTELMRIRALLRDESMSVEELQKLLVEAKALRQKQEQDQADIAQIEASSELEAHIQAHLDVTHLYYELDELVAEWKDANQERRQAILEDIDKKAKALRGQRVARFAWLESDLYMLQQTMDRLREELEEERAESLDDDALALTPPNTEAKVGEVVELSRKQDELDRWTRGQPTGDPTRVMPRGVIQPNVLPSVPTGNGQDPIEPIVPAVAGASGEVDLPNPEEDSDESNAAAANSGTVPTGADLTPIETKAKVTQTVPKVVVSPKGSSSLTPLPVRRPGLKQPTPEELARMDDADTVIDEEARKAASNSGRPTPPSNPMFTARKEPGENEGSGGKGLLIGLVVAALLLLGIFAWLSKDDAPDKAKGNLVKTVANDDDPEPAQDEPTWADDSGSAPTPEIISGKEAFPNGNFRVSGTVVNTGHPLDLPALGDHPPLRLVWSTSEGRNSGYRLCQVGPSGPIMCTKAVAKVPTPEQVAASMRN